MFDNNVAVFKKLQHQEGFFPASMLTILVIMGRTFWKALCLDGLVIPKICTNVFSYLLFNFF